MSSSAAKRLARLEKSLVRSEPDEALRQRLNRGLARLGLPPVDGPVYRTTCPSTATTQGVGARHDV